MCRLLAWIAPDGQCPKDGTRATKTVEIPPAPRVRACGPRFAGVEIMSTRYALMGVGLFLSGVTVAACSTTDEASPPPPPAAATQEDASTGERPDATASPVADASAEPPAPDKGPPRVDVPNAGPYGTHVFDVPANAYWVSSGLFLRAGETAAVSVQGTWNTTEPNVGPEGSSSKPLRGCHAGALVARSDLQFEDASLYCISRSSTFKAARDGIVYFGSLAGSDLGADTYEYRRDYTATLKVTLTSNGRTAPWIDPSKAAAFPFSAVESGRLEIHGKNVIVVTSAAQAEADRAGIPGAIAFLDKVYDTHYALRGLAPASGQRIRFVTDPAIASIGLMLAGNPIRMAPEVFTGGAGSEHLLRSGDAQYDVWGFAHEMGHTFAITPATNWWYQAGPFLEAWPNVFSVTTLQTLARATTWGAHDATYPSAKICPTRATQLASGTYASLEADPALMLCFLLEFKETYGDTFFPEFFKKLNAAPPSTVPAPSPNNAAVWGWLRDRFSEVAKTDTTPIFTKWKIPLA